MQKVSPTVLVGNVDEKAAAVKMAVGGGGALFYGITLNEWVAILTILYMILQIGLLLPKYYAMAQRWWSRK